MTVKFYTLGCKVNQYDSGALCELFCENGYTVAKKDQSPDVMIVNSCTVTAESDRKTRQAVSRYRKKYPDAILVVTGCMTQAVKEKAEKLPLADIVIGNALNQQLLEIVERYKKTKQRIVEWKSHDKTDNILMCCHSEHSEKTRAFVKIQEGCNNFCTYCIVPYARGEIRSKPLEILKNELISIAQKGYKEVVLTGINLNAYGFDFGKDLADAVEMCEKIDGIERVRLGSLEPDRMTDQMLLRLSKCKKFCEQFHLSLQSGSDAVLKAMGRHYDMQLYFNLCDKIKTLFDNPSVTTDIMVGFPTEDDDDFEDSITAVKRIGFSKVHAFVYSVREGTPAAQMKQLDPIKKEARMKVLQEVCDKTRHEFFLSQINKTSSVLFEREIEPCVYEGYTKNYTPVRVKSQTNLSGKIVDTVIVLAFEEWCEGRVL